MADWPGEPYEHVLQQLHRRGLGDGRWGEMRVESGHFLTVSPPSGESDRFGLGDQWKLHVKHPGDPFGSWIVSGLGRDHTQVPDRVISEMRHPAVIRHMQDQMARAHLNGDPYGDNHHGGPGQWADQPSAIFNRHD